jgi:DNA polymerase/3'-5' exonuclease PolX
MSALPPSNAQIAEALTAEAETRDGYGAKALHTAARIIATFPEPVTDANQLKGVRGLGEGTRKRVAAILAQGLSHYVPPPKPEPPRTEPVSEGTPPAYDFTQIKFFGRVANRSLHAHGLQALADLEAAVATASRRYEAAGMSADQGLILESGVTVTANQLAGLRYREHLALRVPRSEVKELGEEVLRVAAGFDLKGDIAGSYRRGKEDSGDVDVLLTGPRNRLSELVQQLWDLGIIRYTFSLGEVKFMGVAVRPTSLFRSETGELESPVEVVRRSLDIRFVPTETYGCSLLFATGSEVFNVKQRQIAIDQGLKLSEYGLVDAQGQRLPVHTEADVFTALGMEYVVPSER